MRSDFNKLLTEAPRLGSSIKFHDVRNAKGNTFDEDAKGGKVSIHKHRRNGKGQRRNFNENLNTLRRYIASNVGRPWDKVYSEICANFDKRKVINDHILVHLFQYVEINAKMIDGRVCVLNSYRRYRSYDYTTGTYGDAPEDYYDKRWTPIKEDSCDWYVHPIDGLLKENKGHKTRRQAKKIQDANRVKDKHKVYRYLNEFEELHFEDGVWFLYTLKVKPAPREIFGIPGYSEEYFADLPKAEQMARGKFYKKDIEYATYNPAKNNRFGDNTSRLYYAKRELANKKLLKAHNLVGTATFDEDAVDPFNHREFAALKKAA